MRRKLLCHKNLIEEKLSSIMSIVSAFQDQARSDDEMRMRDLIKTTLGEIMEKKDMTETSLLGLRSSRRGEGNTIFNV